MPNLIKNVIDGRPDCYAAQFNDSITTLMENTSTKEEKLLAIHTLATLCNASILEPDDDEQEIEFADYSFIYLDPIEEEKEEKKAS